MRKQRLTLLVVLGAVSVAAAVGGGAQAGGTRVPLSSEFTSAQADLSMSPGKSYKVRVNVENKGARSWQPGEVTLLARWSAGPGSPKGIEVNGCNEKLPRAVSTNLSIPLTGEVTGPSMPGDWVLTLRMAHKGKPFGDTRTLKINVPTDYKADVSVSYPAKMDVNRKYPVKIKVRNVGLSDWDHKRVFLRLQVVKASNNAFEDFLGEKVITYGLPDVLKAGDQHEFPLTITAQASGKYEVDVFLWDADDKDEISSPEPMKVEVR